MISDVLIHRLIVFRQRFQNDLLGLCKRVAKLIIIDLIGKGQSMLDLEEAFLEVQRNSLARLGTLFHFICNNFQ